MNEGHPADGNEGLFSSLFKKITGKVKKDDDVTEEEIMDMVNEGHEQGVLKENEAEMIGNIFEFGEKHASDVMTHRKSIVGIEADTTVEEAFEFIMGENYSRYPVYDGDIDNIIGILHIRDLLKIYSEEKNRKKKLVDMKHQVLFDASYIPETRNISVLFKEMQSDKVHMAVVVDEYGQTAGIVTMEDLIEEVMGDIQDEYDDEEEPEIKTVSENVIKIEGSTDLEDVADELEIEMPVDEYDTLGGFIIGVLYRIPEPNEKGLKIEYKGYRFYVDKVEDNRIAQVTVLKLPNN